MRFTKSKKLKLGLVSIPNYGHMHPLSQIAKALVDRGHEVHIITVGNETREKVEKIFESMPEVNLIFTEGPLQSTLTIHLATNDKGETGDEAFLNEW